MQICGNMAFGRKWGGVIDQAGKFCFDTLKPPVVRIGIPLKLYKEIGDAEGVHDLLVSLGEINQKSKIIASIWYVPPEYMDKYNRFLSSATVPFLNLLKQWLDLAEETYGVKVEALSFNEPDGGHAVFVTAPILANIMAQSASVMPHKWMIADTTKPISAKPYIDAVMANPAAKANSCAIAYHSWNKWAWTEDDLVLVAEAAIAAGLPVWVTELGLKADYPHPFNSQQYANDIKAMYELVKTYGIADQAFYWQYSPDSPTDFPLLDLATLETYPVYSVVKALAESENVASPPTDPIVDEPPPDAEPTEELAAIIAEFEAATLKLREWREKNLS